MRGLKEGETAEIECLERGQVFDLHFGGAVERVRIEHVLIVSDEQVCEERNVCV